MSIYRMLMLMMVSVSVAVMAVEAPKQQAVEATSADKTSAGKTDPKADPKAKKKGVDPFSQLAEEEKWTFAPPADRADVFRDLEALLQSELETKTVKTALGVKPITDDIPGLREWAKGELARVESFIFERKWDDAIKSTEAGLKRLQPRVGEDSTIAQITEKMKRYRIQAEEAKILEEAQTKFDALGLRIEGILWSPAGSLAVISGEPRARAINERVKDCVIINIDTNRVDFLFHYNRRRFEFQRYVGEDVTAKKPGQTK